MKFWIFLFTGFVHFALQSQPDLEGPLKNCHLNEELIKKHKIQSLTVFSDMDERGIDGSSTDSGKLREYEFDANGRVVYKHTASNGGNGFFIYYDKGSRLEYSTYDERGFLINFCRENYREINDCNYEYDQDENVTLEEYIWNGPHGRSNYKRSYTWLNGEMIETVDLNDHEGEGKSALIFDKKGRILENSFANRKIRYQYKSNLDTMTSIETTYIDDTISLVRTNSHLSPSQLNILQMKRVDGSGKLMDELNIEYDAHRNVTRYHFVDLKEVYENEEKTTPEPTLIEITNKYDDRGLLIEQRFYRTYSFRPERLLVQVNRYIYESVPLEHKIEKGTISINYLRKQELRDY